MFHFNEQLVARSLPDSPLQLVEGEHSYCKTRNCYFVDNWRSFGYSLVNSLAHRKHVEAFGVHVADQCVVVVGIYL